MAPKKAPEEVREPLTPEDLNWWYSDQPRQRNTMAMLMLLDRPPDPERLRANAWRAVESVPRLGQRVVDAPFDIALPRWERDPTFDLEYHLRRYSLHAGVDPENELDELFHSIGPIYERPFDRARPLWELIEIDRPRGRSALFCRLHHSIADGVGANAVLGALTDAEREGEPAPVRRSEQPGTWPEPSFTGLVGRALRDRASDELGRARGMGRALSEMVREPGRMLDFARGGAELSKSFVNTSRAHLDHYGRSRRLGGLAIPFGPLRDARKRLGGRTVALLLTGVAGAMGEWHRSAGRGDAETVLTTVPINLRARDDQGLETDVGNRLTAIILHLPIAERDPRKRFERIHEMVEAQTSHPALDVFPLFYHALAALPRRIHRAAVLASGSAMDLIVTNIPGLPVTRFIAGAEITAPYPIAPTVPHCPVSVALYGYRDQLFVGLDADGTAMPELDGFSGMLERAFEELVKVA
jgi:WS/DGAT/MGAT family acyltransferase